MNKIGLYLAIGCAGLAAQTDRIISGAPDRNEERALEEKYHISPTEEGLLGALTHQSPEVRNFAALRLGARGDKAAIPSILAALAAETVEGVKVTQAISAAQLGATEGVNALKSMCGDTSWSPSMRLVAANGMLVVGSEECLSDVLDVLRLEAPGGQASLDDRQAARSALNLLTYRKFKQLTAGQIDEIRGLSAVYLKSPAPDVRMAAGLCIRDLGGPWAISQLRAAIDSEREEAVRNSLAKDLLSVGNGR
jgi:HEAT repeat protein